MMSETTTKPTDATGCAAPDAPAANADAASSSAEAVPPEPVEEPAENDHDAASAVRAASSSAGSRKRVFTFQKRWLHTLPIMEKVLPDSALDAASVVALRAANLLGEDGKPVDDGGARDVVVCMLCDDPSASREPLKLWSRLNCRRGRIENHLMSKHPEFMLLLKQKRETEGDLAVQIFLQHMREGRCNVRHEISAGLYSHMQSAPSAELAHNKRAFAHDEFMMPTTTTTPAVSLSKQSQPSLSHETASETALEAEARRKRLKTNGNADATATTSADADGTADLLGVSLLSYHGPAAFSQWKNLMVNKMIVVTGGEMPVIARVATNLWLVGANVLVTFAEQAPMESFAASYLTQFHAAGSMEPPRGIMLPLYCSLRSRPEIEEWSRSIASKFGQVDFLLNFVHNDVSRENPVSVNANRCRELCEVFSGACMQRTGRSAIINMACEAECGQESDDTCAAVETLTKSMSLQLRALNVQVNALVLQKPDTVPIASGDEDIELIHLILFLLSPASACVSGSVLCHRKSVPVSAARATAVSVVSQPALGGTPDTTTSTQTSDTTATTTINAVEVETHEI